MEGISLVGLEINVALLRWHGFEALPQTFGQTISSHWVFIFVDRVPVLIFYWVDESRYRFVNVNERILWIGEESNNSSYR